MNTDNEPTFIMADFSSAISEEVLNHGHYEPSGPSKRELTLQYAAPEIYLAGDNDAYNTSLSESYDIWGIGVLFLELILGTENVFEVDQRTAAMISSRLEHRRRFHDYGKLLEKTLFLAGLADYCIFQPPQENGDIQNGDAISISAVSGAESDRSTVITKVQNLIDSTSNPDSAQEKEESTECLSNHLHPIVQRSQCGIGEFRRAILRRDILGIGFHDLWGLDLLYRLLRWDPDQRMRIDDALRHAYFVGPYVSAVDGSEHATEDDMKTHEAHQSIKREKQEDKNAMPRDSDDMNRELKSTSDSSRAADSTRASSLGDMRIAQYILREDDDTEATPSGEVRYLSPAIIEESFNLTFFCPKCMRKFSDWQACQHHMSSRRHGRRCAYEPSSPSPCLSEHSMLPIDRGSGWCDLQGRRRYVEDEHAIIFSDKYKFFGVFDGHFGNRAARFVARQLHGMFAIYSQTDFLKFSRTENVERNASPSEELLASTQMQGDSNSGSDELPSTLPTDEKWAEEAAQRMDEANDNDSWQDVVELSNLKEFVAMSREEDSLTIHDALSALKMAFLRTDSEFQRVTSAQERSGTTATVVIVFENHIMVGHVGDSRVVLCCSPGGQAMQLTADHTPYLKREKARVLSLGGEVKGEAVLRVNGVLAVTRSIGDVALKPLLTAEPDLLALRRTPIFVEKNDTMEGSALPRARASALAPASSSSDNTASNNESDCFAYRRKIFQAIQESLGGEIQDELIIWENVRKSQLFLIVASDGLWDVVSNDDGSELVCDFLMKQMTSIDAYASFLPADAFHNAAKLLAHEALVRGASDNIGVCVVNLLDFEQYRADAGAYR
jgi:serine/threonine protein phosphatase PrpC/serine/threonine protein kinase